jgi:uncharacterized protein (TIGR02284 family)
MAEHTERTVINHLIEVCRDAERGFRLAADQVKTAEVKRLFLRLAAQRHAFAEELRPHAYRLGDAAVSEGTSLGSLHRTWMQVRARIAFDTERAVLAETARGERFARSVYDEAVLDMLPPETRDTVEAQDFGIRIAGRLVAGMAER